MQAVPKMSAAFLLSVARTRTNLRAKPYAPLHTKVDLWLIPYRIAGMSRIADLTLNRMLRTCSNARFGEVVPQRRELA